MGWKGEVFLKEKKTATTYLHLSVRPRFVGEVHEERVEGHLGVVGRNAIETSRHYNDETVPGRAGEGI